MKTLALILFLAAFCFNSEYQFLKKYAAKIDVAFVPPVSGEKLQYTLQNMELFKLFLPGLVLPMHAAAGSVIYVDFSKALKVKLPSLNIAVPMKMGDRFTC